MIRKIILWFLAGIVTLILLLLISIPLVIEPILEKKIRTLIQDKSTNYIVKIAMVKVNIYKSSIDIEGISIFSRIKNIKNQGVTATIASVNFNGISLFKAVFKQSFMISAINISDVFVKRDTPFDTNIKAVMLSPSNIHIGEFHCKNINFKIHDSATAKFYAIKGGNLNFSDLNIKKNDTVNPSMLNHFSFESNEIKSVSADSMYTYILSGISYSTATNQLKFNTFSIIPSYKDYDFTAKYKYTIDCIEARFINIKIHNFSIPAYFQFKEIKSTFVEIGKMNLTAFRDNRRKDDHAKKLCFQDVLYNLPYKINIDTFGITNGNIKYTEHDEEANKPGSLHFDNINARIYHISNDTIYKSKTAFFELKGKAKLMGKSNMRILLKARLFDKENTFSMEGDLSGIKANDLNPMLMNNAYVYARTCIIDGIKFNFTANNHKASGKLTMRYHALDITVKDKKNDDTTGIKEKIVSLIANIKVHNSNPLPGEKVRIGIISYKRDPERFLFNYCFKSMLTGIKYCLIE
ncbi:MAG: hypothetical protein NTZ33_06870 [Bacteroidetes bacterium]|nr:hypothetical protein [Bacteroidota bacterium]